MLDLGIRVIAVASALATAAWTPAAQAAKPDLTVRAVDRAPAAVAPGRTVMVSDTTANQGRKRAGGTGRTMRTRIAGATYSTDLPAASFQDGWHYFAVTKTGDDVRLYVDAKRLPLRLTNTGTVASSAGAWHIMRNGRGVTNAYTQGRADEVAVYSTALAPGDIQRHYELGKG